MPVKRYAAVTLIACIVLLTCAGVAEIINPTVQAESDPKLDQLAMAAAVGQMAGQLGQMRDELRQSRADSERRAIAAEDSMRALADAVEGLTKSLDADREERAKRWPR